MGRKKRPARQAYEFSDRLSSREAAQLGQPHDEQAHGHNAVLGGESALVRRSGGQQSDGSVR